MTCARKRDGLWRGLLAAAWKDIGDRDTAFWLQKVEAERKWRKGKLLGLARHFHQLWTLYAGMQCHTEEAAVAALRMMHRLHREAVWLERGWSNDR